MATRIRLQRHGKKGKAFFHIIVADSRSKRDGRFIEKVGTYNPNANPAQIDIDFERCLHWVHVGAEPSDTCRAILSYKGVLMKEHLLRGVSKGAHTEEQAEAKFNNWLDQKSGAIDSKKTGLAKAKADAERARLAAEKAKNDARAAAIAAANTPVEEVVEEAPAEETASTEEVAVEAAPTEEVAAEEAPASSEEATETKSEA